MVHAAKFKTNDLPELFFASILYDCIPGKRSHLYLKIACAYINRRTHDYHYIEEWRQQMRSLNTKAPYWDMIFLCRKKTDS